MPDNEVTIDTSTAVWTWTFSAGNITMKKNGTIKLKRANGSQWTFASAQLCNGSINDGQFTFKTPGNNIIDIDDTCTTAGTWHYNVTATLASGPNAGTQTSPDPDIVNDPGNAGDR